MTTGGAKQRASPIGQARQASHHGLPCFAAGPSSPLSRKPKPKPPQWTSRRAELSLRLDLQTASNHVHSASVSGLWETFGVCSKSPPLPLTDRRPAFTAVSMCLEAPWFRPAHTCWYLDIDCKTFVARGPRNDFPIDHRPSTVRPWGHPPGVSSMSTLHCTADWTGWPATPRLPGSKCRRR